MDLQGKEYLQVAHRLVWFREEHPDWVIETEIGDGFVKAKILRQDYLLVATAHKSIGQGKRFPLETAETGAIGRALALCGYGTQFCGDELDEGDEIADAPIDNLKKQALSAIAEVRRAMPTISENKIVVGDALRTQIKVNEPDVRSEKELAYLKDLSEKMGWTPSDVKGQLTNLGLQKAKYLNPLQYKKLVENIECYPKQGFPKL